MVPYDEVRTTLPDSTSPTLNLAGADPPRNKGQGLRNAKLVLCCAQSLQNDRIESLELLLQHLPKVRPSWWQMPDKSKIKVGHKIPHTCRPKAHWRGQ